MPMMAVKLSVSPATGSVQWQSLLRDDKGQLSVTKSAEKQRAKVWFSNEKLTKNDKMTSQHSAAISTVSTSKIEIGNKVSITDCRIISGGSDTDLQPLDYMNIHEVSCPYSCVSVA